MSMVQAAALFGLALAVRNPDGADVWGFANGQFREDPVRRGRGILRRHGQSVLKATEAFCGKVGRVGHGTEIAKAVRATYSGHDRVVILTDMQTFPDTRTRRAQPRGVGDVSAAVPAPIPVYGFNLVGYTHGAMPAGHGNRHEMGGLTDRSFAQIVYIERGARADWPWLDQPAA